MSFVTFLLLIGCFGLIDCTGNHAVRFQREKSAITTETTLFVLKNNENLKSVQLSAFPSAIKSGEDVVISWTGIQPNSQDMIAVHCGVQANNSDFMDAILIEAGSPSVRFVNLIMLRCDYVFTYLQFQSQNAYNNLATVTVQMKESWKSPKQGHVSFTSDPQELVVSWISGDPSTPIVKYGLSANELNWKATGTSETYNASNLCSEPANITAQNWYRDPGIMHHVVLTDLNFSTPYWFSYGSVAGGFSHVRRVLSRPPLVDFEEKEEVKFLAYADFGTGAPPGSFSTLSNCLIDVMNGFDNFLLHFGDISYAMGTGWNWDAFLDFIEPLATSVPYLMTIGNHEYDWVIPSNNDPSGQGPVGWHPPWGNMGDDSNGECAVPCFHRFKSPTNGLGIFYYSFDYKMVHVIQMSSEHDWTRGSEMYNWLESDLASVNRTVTPWVVVTIHRMMYTTQLQEDGDFIVSEVMKEELEDLIYQYKVNLFLVGHQHSYERTCPVYKKECIPSGEAPTHIVVGTAGAGLEKGGFAPNLLGNWSLVQLENWGYLRISAKRQKMLVEFIENNSSSVYDSVELLPWF